jgi:type II secretory pathway pseudopilin PulG
MVELLVVILIMGIVTAMIASFYSSTMKTVHIASALRTNTAMASNAMNELARTIRAGTENPLRNQALPAPVFVVAQPNTVVLYAYVNLRSSDQTPVMVRFSVDAERRLIEEKWPAVLDAYGYWAFPAVSQATGKPTQAPASSRVLASAVALPGNGVAPLFTYEDVAGDPVTMTSAGVSSSVIPDVAAVRVSVAIQGSTADAAARVVLENTVGIPNLGVNRSLE